VRSRTPGWVAGLFLLLGVGLMVGMGIANLRFTQTVQDANAFLPRWEGANAWLTRGISPYDPQVSHLAQRQLYGRAADPDQGEDLALFAYPLPAMLLYAPFGAFAYPVARAAWMTLLELALPLAALLGLRLAGWRPPVLLAALSVAFSVAWAPGFRSIVAGSPAALALLFSLSALVCVERNFDPVAGVLFALAVIDPAPGGLLLISALVWAVSRRRWVIVASSLVTASLLIATSLVLLPGWPLAWLQQLAGWIGLGGSTMPSSTWPILGPGVLPEILTAGLLLACAWAWWRSWGGGVRWLAWSAVFTLALADWLTLAAVGRSSSVSLLPAILLILGTWARRAPRWGPWISGASLVLVALASWTPFLFNRSGSPVGVTAGSAVPLLAALGLLWVRWWATRGADIRDLALETGVRE